MARLNRYGPLLCALSQVTLAQPPANDAQADGARRKQVDALFAAVNTNSSPGCSISVMRNGAVVYAHGYGMADLDHGIANGPGTVYHVASMSKQFTAAAIQLLASEGKLSLDDPVRKYIPELHDFGTPITLRELLNHTSGMRDQWDLLGLAGWRYSLDLITDDDVMSVLTRQRSLNFPPNTRFSYSNSGFTLLAQVVKRVSGVSLREFTSARIFKPLGMSHSHFRDDHAEIVPNIAYGYESAGDTFRLSVTNFDTVGATSLLTTVEDLALWDENFYHPRVLNPQLLKQMTTPGRLADGKPLQYGLGLFVDTYRGLPVVSHAGADAGYRSELVRFPEQHFSVACLCNLAQTDPSTLAHQIADLYLAGQLQPDSASESPRSGSFVPDSATLSRWVGTYLDRTTLRKAQITLDDQVLHVHPGGPLVVELQLADASHATTPQLPVTLELLPGAGTTIRGLTVSQPGQPADTYDRVAPYKPAAEQLAQWAGTYYSEEVDARWQIEVKSGQLMLSSIKMKPTRLEPATADIFIAPFGGLQFERRGGRVSGFTVATGRVTGLRFKKVAPPQQL
jgi:CubicO group peptidase (beta-lactamase class C family)